MAATSLSKSCKGEFPAGSVSSSTFVQVQSVTGSCNSTLVPDASVAMDPAATYPCGTGFQLSTLADQLYGNRTKQDLCPACAGDFGQMEGHIDSYTSSDACSGRAVGDLGNFWTIKN